MKRRFVLALTFSIIAAGVIIASIFGVLDVKFAVTIVVLEFPLGIISDFLSGQRNAELPQEVRQTIIEPDSPEARRLSEEEERLRKAYPKFFVFLDSIRTVGSQHEFNRLEAHGGVIIAFEMLTQGEATYANLGDDDLLQSILLARLVNASNFERHWWD